jgi:hypothetical protein
MAGTFAALAPKLGLQVVGPSIPPLRPAALRAFVRRLKERGVDGVFMAGLGPNQGGPPVSGTFVPALRRDLGHSLPVVADDGFLNGFGRADTAPGHPIGGTYISGAYFLDPAHELPPVGQRFVRDFSATQPGRIANTFTPVAAQSTEVLLAAIAMSDGTRKSVAENLLRVKISNGILGSFGFDANGDMTRNSMPIFRVPEAGANGSTYPVFTVITLPGDYVQSLFR